MTTSTPLPAADAPASALLPRPDGLEVPGAEHPGLESEFWDAVELNWSAVELIRRGLPLRALECERGRGLGCRFSYRGVRMAVSSYVDEGPHYYMLSIDISSALVQGEAPEALVADLLTAMSVPEWVRCWKSKGLDGLFHLRADEKFAREVLGVDSLTRPV